MLTLLSAVFVSGAQAQDFAINVGSISHEGNFGNVNNQTINVPPTGLANVAQIGVNGTVISEDSGSQTFASDGVFVLLDGAGQPLGCIIPAPNQGAGANAFIDAVYDIAEFNGVSCLGSLVGPVPVPASIEAIDSWTVEYPNSPRWTGLTLTLIAGGVAGGFVESTVNGTPGFAGTIDAGAPFPRQPGTIAARQAQVATDYAGCTLEEAAGTWVRSRTPRVEGAAETSGPISGPGITNMSVDGVLFAASLQSGGRLVGQGADGRFFQGWFSRLSSARSVWYGTIIDCP